MRDSQGKIDLRETSKVSLLFMAVKNRKLYIKITFVLSTCSLQIY